MTVTLVLSQYLMGKMQCLRDAKAAHAPWYQAAAGMTPGMATQLQVSCCSWLGLHSRQ